MAGERRKRVALYARVSTLEQSTDLQVDELRALARQRGWEVHSIYVDRGVSGAKDRRPELDRLLKDVHRGRVECVCCWKLDRISRSVRHLVMLVDDFAARGVDFCSVTDSIDTGTPAGRFQLHVLGAVAQLERELTRERVRAGLHAAKRRGAKIGRPRVHVDVAKARQLQAEGLSLRKIATQLGCGLATLCRALKADAAAPEPVTSVGSDLAA